MDTHIEAVQEVCVSPYVSLHIRRARRVAEAGHHAISDRLVQSVGGLILVGGCATVAVHHARQPPRSAVDEAECLIDDTGC